MIKRTLYFSNPAYLSTRNKQLVVDKQMADQSPALVPIEDVGVVILDHPQITITHTLMGKLLENNVAIITCNEKHMPCGLMLNLDGHTLQSQRFQAQIQASLPLKKQLWQQTIQAKILNQAKHLDVYGVPTRFLYELVKQVRSGDTGNCEATAAAYYWKHLFPEEWQFYRDRMGPPPNQLLNYAYSILRACVARSLSGSGLLPTLGIFHRNQYNAYCLADDIMEPFRPYVDKVVREMSIAQASALTLDISTEQKRHLLNIPAMDVVMEGQQRPLLVAIQRTTASLAKSFDTQVPQLIYPEL